MKFFFSMIIILGFLPKIASAQTNDSTIERPSAFRVSHSASFGFDPDEGIKLGGGILITGGGSRKESCRSLTELTGLHAFSTRSWRFRVQHEMLSVLGQKTDLITDLDIRIPNNTSYFYGYGMSSVYNKNQPEKFRYYRARYDMADAGLGLRHHFSSKTTMLLGTNYEYYEMDATNKLNAKRFISQTGTGPGKNGLTASGIFNLQKYLGFSVSFNADTRNNKLFPEKGIQWQTSVRHLKELKNARYDPTIFNSDLSFYLPVVANRLTFADRIGVGTTFGRFGFQHAQYLGNNDNLRGFRKERWAGRSKAFNQAELRWRVSNFRTRLFPGSLGILFFADAGKVWMPAEKDDHTAIGYGGGFWLAPWRKLLITINYAISKEDRIPSVSLGWRF